MDRIGIAVVGCWGMAKPFHLPAIAMLADLFELVAVCDRFPERAEEAGRRYGVPWYTDARRMLEGEKRIQAVSDLVTAVWHRDVAVLAAEHGKHVIVEKPISLTLPWTDQMIDACVRNKVLLEVSENYPRMPVDAAVNEMARSGFLGTVKAVQVMDAINGGSIDLGVHRYGQLREAAGGRPMRIKGVVQEMPTLLRPRDLRPEGQPVTERDFGDRGEEWDVGMVEFDNGVAGKCELFPLGRESAVWAGDLRKVVGTKGVSSDDLWPSIYPPKAEGQLSVKLVAGPGAYEDLPIRLVREKLLGMTLITRIEAGSPARFVWENPVAEVMRRAPEPAGEVGHGWGDWTVAAVTTYQQFGRSIRDGAPQYWGHEKGRSDLELSLAMFESGLQNRALDLPLAELTAHERHTHEEFERLFHRPALGPAVV
jgi:predicted dehydrogenase